ncbi:hypothetical protein [Microvirga terricola]|uniref:Surface antigen domain-containing protein n=1 Tax=Microvirga terricola TaxID=2719797 RepID=A0ABX0V8V7_9HYPH|nr:hypothetical protein [Microvirga terricola]NIX75634.1 hypothetical protein [Microvirga terricola]
MAPSGKLAGVVLLCFGQIACNQTASMQVANAAAGLDPTGVAGTALSFAQSVQPEEDHDAESGFKLSQIAVSLDDVAAGRTARPRLANPIQGMMTKMAANQAMNIASTIIGGAMTGGVGLAAAAPGLLMQAASTGMVMGQMAAMDSQVEQAMAQAEAARAANRIVPDEDRPAEARAILSIVNGGRSAVWRNAESGASGKVSLGHLNKAEGMSCRVVEQEWKGGGETRKGNFVICIQDGIWYDLS